MEKQIMIKHAYMDKTFKIKNIISCLKMFVDSLTEKIIFNFVLNANQSEIFKEIINLKYLDNADIIKIETGKKYYKFDIAIGMDNVVKILNLIENHELSVMIYYNDIKMFINDNDGDFIIINSNHEKYKSIKKQIKLTHKYRY